MQTAFSLNGMLKAYILDLSDLEGLEYDLHDLYHDLDGLDYGLEGLDHGLYSLS